MSQTRHFNRRTFLGTGLVVGTAGTALALRAVLAHERANHRATPAAGTPGATPGATPAAAATPGATPAAAATHLIEMTDELKFDPAELTLKVGDTVTWRTVGAAPHTSTCDPDEANNPEEHVQLPEGAETWNSGFVNTDEEFSRTFDVPGEYTYFCIPHEAAGMIGYLTVKE